jgi:hypothetical protein
MSSNMLTNGARAAIGVLLLAAGVWIAGAPTIAFQKANPVAFNGMWKLNAAASMNPDGPPAAQAARGGRGGGSRSGGGNAGAGGGGGDEGGGTPNGGPAGGTLGNEEKARFYAMLIVLERAPKDMVVAATDKDITLTLDAGKPLHEMTDDKKVNLPTGSKVFGDLEIKTKWDGASLRREIKTIDGLTVIETYALSPDGKQLLVSLDIKSQVERLADAQKLPIKRVYDRVQ